MTTEEVLGYAAWTNSKGVSYLFSAWDDSSASSAILLKAAIDNNGYAGTSVILDLLNMQYLSWPKPLPLIGTGGRA